MSTGTTSALDTDISLEPFDMEDEEEQAMNQEWAWDHECDIICADIVM